jgi:hypothetical protein
MLARTYYFHFEIGSGVVKNRIGRNAHSTQPDLMAEGSPVNCCEMLYGLLTTALIEIKGFSLSFSL